MATNRTTTTVAVRLDLAELIGQLRNLADTLETTQKPKMQDDGPGTTEPDKPTDCERCGTSYDNCTNGLHGPRHAACCASCYNRATHNQHIWEAWNRRQPKPAEDTPGECKHEAWDVHPNGITRHCSDCRAPLHDLEGDRLAAGKLSDEALAALRRKLSGQPEPSHFIDGTKPARNPHTLDLPDGLDPAEAQHMLDVIADAQSGRTAPVLIRVAASSDLDPQPLRCPQCDHPWHPRAICPTCGCDQR